jgi:predicted DNA binding CopG/RHH family protein
MTMDFIAENGKVITDEMFDQMAKEYEDETWDASKLGKATAGRPSIADEEVVPITFRLPASKVRALDAKASAHGSTRSKELREAVGEYLARA